MPFSILAIPTSSNKSIEQVRQAHRAELDAIAHCYRLTNYLSAAQIYLKDNFLLKKPLKPEHLKDWILGHWGTCPGINLIYAHLNCLIQHHDISVFLITAAGHGAPAILANLYLEGSLQILYPELTLNADGLAKLIRDFSCDPRHLYAGTPGTIHAGEKLGYALDVAFSSVMDHPDLIVACIIGDIAEIGALANAWDSYKFIDPAESGAVLPILHLNGHNTSTSTLYGSMNNVELQQRFTGYGYQVRIVGSQDHSQKDLANQNGLDLDADLYDSLDWAYREICRIQQAARSRQPIAQPKFPLLIVRLPPGWTGIKEIAGVPRESSHQVPLKNLKTDSNQLQLLENWLRSYQIEELFDQQDCPIPEILNLCPQGEQRMGCNPHTFGGINPYSKICS